MNRSALSFAQLRVLGTKRGVRQATTIGVLEDRHETIRVGTLAGVEAKHLLVNVAVQVERARRDVGALNRALEAAPKVFNVTELDITSWPNYATATRFRSSAIITVAKRNKH